jgi:hypothetical protein
MDLVGTNPGCILHGLPDILGLIDSGDTLLNYSFFLPLGPDF